MIGWYELLGSTGGLGRNRTGQAARKSEHPNQVVTALGVRSRAEQRRMIEQVRALFPLQTHEKPKVLGYGPKANGVVEIRVKHGEHVIAGEIAERWDEAVDVKFGDVAQPF